MQSTTRSDRRAALAWLASAVLLAVTMVVATVPAGATPGNGRTVDHQGSARVDQAPGHTRTAGAHAAGSPCDGCVGRADGRQPAGQTRDQGRGADRASGDSGLTCGSNAGVGAGNPAHSGCTTTSEDPDDGYQPPVICEAQADGSLLCTRDGVPIDCTNDPTSDPVCQGTSPESTGGTSTTTSRSAGSTSSRAARPAGTSLSPPRASDAAAQRFLRVRSL